MTACAAASIQLQRTTACVHQTSSSLRSQWPLRHSNAIVKGLRFSKVWIFISLSNLFILPCQECTRDLLQGSRILQAILVFRNCEDPSVLSLFSWLFGTILLQNIHFKLLNSTQRGSLAPLAFQTWLNLAAVYDFQPPGKWKLFQLIPASSMVMS